MSPRSGVSALVAAVGILIVGLGAAAPVAGQSVDPVAVEIAPAEAQVDLGETIDLTVTITDRSGASTDDLVVHLDVTTIGSGGSVDPEDWTKTLTKNVGPLDADGSATVDWRIQPISPGRFQAYAVVLSPGSNALSASDVLVVDVADRRSLNPEGILPVALSVPTGIGLLLAARVARTRTRRWR